MLFSYFTFSFFQTLRSKHPLYVIIEKWRCPREDGSERQEQNGIEKELDSGILLALELATRRHKIASKLKSLICN